MSFFFFKKKKENLFDMILFLLIVIKSVVSLGIYVINFLFLFWKRRIWIRKGLIEWDREKEERKIDILILSVIIGKSCVYYVLKLFVIWCWRLGDCMYFVFDWVYWYSILCKVWIIVVVLEVNWEGFMLKWEVVKLFG